jgi:hemoglobin/transferrin/lactoferrin receptor protein
MKLKLFLPIILAGLTIFLSTNEPLTAQPGDQGQRYDSILSRELSEVVVSANRYGSIRVKTPEAIRVLDAGTVKKKQLRTAPEALLLTPGVFVQKTNHGGGSPFIRGLTGNQTLLLIDGIRLSNSTARYGPNQYFNTVDIFGLEKFEVMRGSGSVQYGSDAIGGTIQAFTRDVQTSTDPYWNGQFLGRISTHGMEQTGHGNFAYSSRSIAFRGGLTGRHFGDITGGDTTGRQTPTGYSEFDYDFKTKLNLPGNSSLVAVVQSVHQYDVPVFHKIALENYALNRMDPQERKLSYLRYRKDIDHGTLKNLVLTASWQKSSEARESRKNNSQVLRTENDIVRTVSFSAESFLQKGIWNSNTGLEIYSDRVGSSRTDTDLNDNSSLTKRGLYPDGAKSLSLAAFSLHSLDLARWSFAGGIRFNQYVNTIEDEALGLVKLKPHALVGSLAVLRKLGETSGLFISANTGFRAPNIDDLGTLGIVDFRYETPNFSLEPEHSLQYQVGYKLQQRRLRGEIYLYRNELYNLIVRNKVPGDTIDGYPVYLKENVERAYIQGVETAWSLQAASNITLNGSLTYTYGQNKTKDEPARRIPPLFGRVSAEYAYGRWDAGIEWMAAAKQIRLAAGDISDNRIPAGGTPGWNVINLNASYSAGKISMALCCNNLLNTDYRYHGSGVNGIGRSAVLTVSLNI